jgi:hypothetical protein
MLSPFRNATYMPTLKWKVGESRALGSLRGRARDQILPLFDMPPAGGFDHEAGRTLLPTEHIRALGPRLYKQWGKRPVFVDGARVDDEKHKAGLAAHPLTEMIERARLAGALACPVTGLNRSLEYQSAVSRFLSHHAPLPICIRVNASDLEAPGFSGRLRLLLWELSCEATRAVLMLDFGGMPLHDPRGFADLLAQRINDLPFLHDWLNVAVCLTSFPEKILLKAGETRRYSRSDWPMYQALFGIREQLLRMPIFGDYAVEFPVYAPPVRATPTAQFRYTTDSAYLVVKGTSVRKPHGYKAILPVAKLLRDQPEFRGGQFSDGNAFIERLTLTETETGNASSWRWATTDHHLTLVAGDLRALFGDQRFPAEVEEVAPTQLQLV